jgi:preprotein translocase subunit YajC
MGSLAAVVAATSSKTSSSSYTFLLLIVLVFVGFYFLMIRPQRRRQQQAQQQQRTLAPGSRVKTTAGMYATVVEVDGDDVILEVAPGVEVRYIRRAVMEVMTSGEDEETEPEADDEVEYAEDAGYEQDDDYPEDSEPSDVDDSAADHSATDHSATDHGATDHGAGAAEPGSRNEDPAGSHDANHARTGTDNAF